jgi:SAM-dependent methyltransferase
MKIPERLAWTIDRLGIAGNETILEIGGGRGIAAALVLSKLTTGRLVGIDRSDKAIEAARALNEVDERAGRLRLVQAAIETFDAGADRFDIAFAINVNLFWIDADAAFKTSMVCSNPTADLPSPMNRHRRARSNQSAPSSVPGLKPQAGRSRGSKKRNMRPCC